MPQRDKTFQYLLTSRDQKGAGFLLLIDPDKYDEKSLLSTVENATDFGADAILIGGSVMMSYRLDDYVARVKRATNLPVIIFPGSMMQLSREADALLFLSLISGRNPEFLIGHHVISAPVIKEMNIEPISTAYLLIESGRATAASFVSNSFPIPRHKPEIAVAHALAAQYLGMKCVYLEAGSGADLSVPEELIYAVKKSVEIPVIVGGGIRTPDEARHKVEAGADFVVIGNAFEYNLDRNYLREMIEAVHPKVPREV